MHQTAVGQHVVSPALGHTLQPLGRSSGPRTASVKKHRAALVIKQLNTLPFQLVGFCRAEPEMGGLAAETVLQVCETSDPAEVSTSRTLKPDQFREGCATANLMSPWIRASKKGLSLWHQ